MSKWREQLESHLSTIDVVADSVLDVGGAAKPVKDRVKSWKVLFIGNKIYFIDRKFLKVRVELILPCLGLLPVSLADFGARSIDLNLLAGFRIFQSNGACGRQVFFGGIAYLYGDQVVLTTEGF